MFEREEDVRRHLGVSFRKERRTCDVTDLCLAMRTDLIALIRNFDKNFDNNFDKKKAAAS